jgi:hypothetical protein
MIQSMALLWSQKISLSMSQSWVENTKEAVKLSESRRRAVVDTLSKGRNEPLQGSLETTQITKWSRN